MQPTPLALLSLVVLSVAINVTAQTQSLVASNTAFALDLYGQLAAPPGNLFFSPYSISTCLAMVYAGAAGDTQEHLSQVLGFGADQGQCASAFGELQRELETSQQPNAMALNIANALWTQRGYPFLPAFLATATNQYQASIGQADFVTQADAVAQAINDWVAQETQNKIQNILPPGSLDSHTRFVVANAVFFRLSRSLSPQPTSGGFAPPDPTPRNKLTNRGAGRVSKRTETRNKKLGKAKIVHYENDTHCVSVPPWRDLCVEREQDVIPENQTIVRSTASRRRSIFSTQRRKGAKTQLIRRTYVTGVASDGLRPTLVRI